MAEQENIPDVLVTPAQRVRNDWKAMLENMSYRAIVNNIPFLAFLAVLCMYYISNSHKAIDMQRELNMKNKELKELRWKYMDVKSALMYTKTEKQIIINAEHIGLKASELPAYEIKK